jgi:glycosyltransferase involved in cell wall biosynthesis
MRVAWFSPVPPVRTGIAGRSAELIEAIRQRGVAIDVYVDERVARVAADAHSAHDFVWRHRRQPYDLTIFQFGNSSHHDYAWPYALRYPGLVVLHDTHLHHARAALLLRERRVDDYRAEFTWNQPAANPDLAEIAIAGFDSTLYYEWPMARVLVETARLVAVHGEGARNELLQSLHHETTVGSDQIVSISLGGGDVLSADEATAARHRVRSALGLPQEAIVFGIFGGLTPEKRIPQALDALSAVLPHTTDARLLLAGAPAEHYDVHADTAARGLTGRVIVTGYLASDRDVTEHLAACDVTINLRWPTARETSGPWLRALAAGRPTIVTDLVHNTGFASLDPRTWAVNVAEDRGPRTEDRRVPGSESLASHLAPRTSSLGPRHSAPVCVAIDILDEGHSLRLAMRRLAVDADLRATLGRAARAWWEREHSVDRTIDDYLWAMARAVERPAPQVDLPAHMRDDGDRTLRALIEPFGAEVTARIQALSDAGARGAE